MKMRKDNYENDINYRAKFYDIAIAIKASENDNAECIIYLTYQNLIFTNFTLLDC